MRSPKISVIVPCYNVQDYVEKCLDSIVSNRYSELEIILINDGSTDQTLETLKKLQQIYSQENLKIIDQSNQGPSETRNKGIQVSQGEYIMFIDSDDWVGPDYFVHFVNSLKGMDLVLASYTREFGNYSKPRSLGVEGKKDARMIQRRMVGLLEKELQDPSQADSIVTVWGKMYKSEILKGKKLKFKSTEEIGTAEDLLFNVDYLHFCQNVFCIDKPLYHYRRNNQDSFTSVYKANLFTLWTNLFNHLFARVKSNGDVFCKAYFNRICLSIIVLGLNEIRNPAGSSTIKKNLLKFLQSPLYEKAFSQLQLRHFPMHWKIFFLFAKTKNVSGLYLMLKAINTLK
ncbi:Glycosyl transferase family 2 [Salegentibacter echinorum]|uniref:Glycosyl transferase family 2 n=1 Tax=Salegentibacter echinorum TaxID=1073325 RepID=A0A1M5BVS7_SALEC|nr:glycosyltransferase family 2 protein [Salegentibacter echinorum]SHF46342.1 Glycosyl transferase family 2 [Salegentibacter echinorum]